MALNLKPFEGPRAPDWTDPKLPMAPGPSANEQEGKSSLENSDTHLLLLSSKPDLDKRSKLKKLDIL